MKKFASILALGLMAALLVAPMASAATISCKTPVLAVSAGQSAGLDTVMAYFDAAGMYYDTADAPTAKYLESGVGMPAYVPKAGDPLPINLNRDNVRPAKEAKGTKYQTVIFIMGCSTKGMGASGLNIDTELKRVESNIKSCETNNIKMIGMQIEGVSARGKAGSDNEKVIDLVTPRMDQLIIYTTAYSYDNKFETLASKNKIPIEVIKSVKDYSTVLKAIFGIK